MMMPGNEYAWQSFVIVDSIWHQDGVIPSD